VVSIVTPVLLVSGVFLNLGPGSSTSIGGYEFLNRDWRTWDEEEWLEFHYLMFQVDDEDDIPQDVLNFLYKLQNDAAEWQAFWQAYSRAIWEND
jgi:hypothetical protein